MKSKNKITAYVLSLSMIAAFSNSISVYADETPTSGTFNEIFSWDFSGDTLTFSVDENYTTKEYVTLSTGGKNEDYELKPWREYLPQVKHIVFDERICGFHTNVWVEFTKSFTDESINFETVTFGEEMDLEEDWYFGYATAIAPKYSYTDYSAFVEGYSFEPNGIAKNPYYKTKDEENKVEYIEDLSLLRMSGSVNYDSCNALQYVVGRYRTVLLQDGVTIEKMEDTEEIYTLRNYFSSGILALPLSRSDLSAPILLCYPSIGADNIEKIRGLVIPRKKENVKVAVLGEANPELKGDVNLDGIVDISDATATLEYYAKRTAGLEASFKNDKELNKFSYYLADTDTESINGADSEDAQIDISDATNILTYYAQSLAGLSPDWETIVSGG